jgi:tetraacyldisaccharide 4'-kinase
LVATFGNVPQTRARLAPIGAEGLAGSRALAFAGIGRPEKFFDTLREANLDLVGTRAFPDHYPYSGVEITRLLVEAEAKGAMLVTTHKDWIRLEAPWRPQVATVMVQAVFDDAAILDHALDRLWPVQKPL